MKIVLADIESFALDAALNELLDAGYDAIGVRRDVSKGKDVEALADDTLEKFGAHQIAETVFDAIREDRHSILTHQHS